MSKYFLLILLLALVSLSGASAVFCQTETFDTTQFTPPKGWTRSTKEGVVIFSNMDEKTKHFCFLTIYKSIPSTGDPKTDFANQWNALIVNPLNAPANPETETNNND